MHDDVLTPQELAAFLKIDEAALRWLLKRGEIPAQQIAGQWRFAKQAVLAWLGSVAVKDFSYSEKTEVANSVEEFSLKNQVVPYLGMRVHEPAKPNPPRMVQQQRPQPTAASVAQTSRKSIGEASFKPDGSYAPVKPFSRMAPWEKGDILSQIDL